MFVPRGQRNYPAPIQIEALDLEQLSRAPTLQFVDGTLHDTERSGAYLVEAKDADDPYAGRFMVAFSADKKTRIRGDMANGRRVAACGRLEVDRECLVANEEEELQLICAPHRIPIDLWDVASVTAREPG